MNKDTLDDIIRWLAIMGSFAMFYFSANFSVDGFNIVVPEKTYMGWTFATIIIIVQLVWNRVGRSGGLTLFIAGLLCYAYGIWTNTLGIMIATEIVKGGWETFTSALIGTFLEVVPEPLLVWALIGQATDPLSHVAGGNVKKEPRMPQSRYKRGF